MSGNLAYEDWAKEDIVDEEDESSGHIDGYPDELIWLEKSVLSPITQLFLEILAVSSIS